MSPVYRFPHKTHRQWEKELRYAQSQGSSVRTIQEYKSLTAQLLTLYESGERPTRYMRHLEQEIGA